MGKNESKRNRRAQRISTEVREVLRERSIAVFEKFVERGWILQFSFTSQGGILDSRGIDLEWFFKPGRNGEVGCTDVQQKTRRPDIKVHFLRHPCVPVYLLQTGDSNEQIEYVFLDLLLKCRSYNLEHEGEIEARLRKLQMHGTVDGEQRVWRNFRESP